MINLLPNPTKLLNFHGNILSDVNKDMRCDYFFLNKKHGGSLIDNGQDCEDFNDKEHKILKGKLRIDNEQN